MPAADLVQAWLRTNLSAPELTGAWLYGSFVGAHTDVGDIDVLVRYRAGWSGSASKLRGRLERLFGETFSIPLHAIFLSETEFEDEAPFIKVLLAHASEISLQRERNPLGRRDA
jgi:predicted nucleotidyltransferase